MQYMAWCDAFALIGGDEPFATVFSEAMSAGKPIVFASDGGITDVAKDGVHGLSVEPGDLASAVAALDRLLGDADLRARLGRGAAELAAQLTWEQNARNVSELFKAAL
jgi:glycosyltransferase involved in cell wall biosynthesis